MTESENPRALIYRDHLLPFSETFILSQVDALRSYAAVLAGRVRVDGIDLAGRETIVVNEGGLFGKSREVRHLLGHPPGDFVTRLESTSPSLLHAHFGTSAVNALPLQSRLDVPLVVTFHGYDATQRSELRNGLMAWRYGRLRHRLADTASCMLAVSDYIRERAIAFVRCDRGYWTRGRKTDCAGRSGRDGLRSTSAICTARSPGHERVAGTTARSLMLGGTLTALGPILPVTTGAS